MACMHGGVPGTWAAFIMASSTHGLHAWRGGDMGCIYNGLEHSWKGLNCEMSSTMHQQ